MKFCVDCLKRSGVSKSIVQFEYLKLCSENSWKIERLGFSLRSILFECEGRLSVLLSNKFDFDYIPDFRFSNEIESIMKDNNFSSKIQKMQENANRDLEQIILEKNDLTRESAHVGTRNELKYFEQKRPDGDAFCSWDPCPCGGLGTVISKGQGYLYIPESSVEFRRDCLTADEFQSKLQQMASNLPFGTDLIFTDVPVLVCDKGIKELSIDPNIAREDAKHWWNTGFIPLRPSRKR
jgi:hypothetical protein